MIDRLLISLSVCASLLLPASAAVAAPQRVALVISDGPEVPDGLPSAPLDAGLIAAALSDDGFDVTALVGLDAALTAQGIERFAGRLQGVREAPLVFVYVVGRGVQFGGDAFYVPASARIVRQADVPREALALTALLKRLQAIPAAGRIFIFDLAHADGPATADPLPLAPGLPLPAVLPGSLIALNAAPGALAPVEPPMFGAYARALNEALRVPGLTPAQMFERIRLRVATMSEAAVVPWSQSALDETVRIGPSGAPPSPVSPSPSTSAETAFWSVVRADTPASFASFLSAYPDDRMAPLVRRWRAMRREAIIWREVRDVDRPEAYWTFMTLYPRGPHYVDVRRRLAALGAPLAPPPRYVPYTLTNEVPPDGEWRDLVAPVGSREADGDVPPPPSGFVPPPPRALFLDLAPPMPLPPGVLPVVPPVETAARPPGVIEQEAIAGLGRVRFERRGMALPSVRTATSDAGLFVRVDVLGRDDGWTAEERDAAEEVQGRLTLRRFEEGRTTLTATDATGAYILDRRTVVDALGQARSVLRDSRLRLIADVSTDPFGHATQSIVVQPKVAIGTFVIPRDAEVPSPPVPAVPEPRTAIPEPATTDVTPHPSAQPAPVSPAAPVSVIGPSPSKPIPPAAPSPPPELETVPEPVPRPRLPDAAAIHAKPKVRPVQPRAGHLDRKRRHVR